MTNPIDHESMLDMYLFETNQNLEQLEQLILASEKKNTFDRDDINDIFRIMHTIKGSSAMMNYQMISDLAHALEDVFFYFRENSTALIDYESVSDLMFDGIDFMKQEIEKIERKDPPDGEATELLGTIHFFLERLKIPNNEVVTSTQVPAYYSVNLRYQEGCEMENIRAFSVIHNLKEHCSSMIHLPEDLTSDPKAAEIIRQQGFAIHVQTDLSAKELEDLLQQTIYLDQLTIQPKTDETTFNRFEDTKPTEDKTSNTSCDVIPQKTQEVNETHQVIAQTYISVNVEKLDKFMDLVGELVIAEAMVSNNPDIVGRDLQNFARASRQLQKITSELQDIAMSIRMVPLEATFKKMHRIVRDMSKKLAKKVDLQIIGETIEVDKNIIDHIADPLMHLVRNAIDHGLETQDERTKIGKMEPATITLEAKNEGSDVLILVRDNGRGLDKEKILQKARHNQLLHKPEEDYTEREIFNLILLPGFSTNEKVTEFSGRGVGMDVVSKNIESVGGAVVVDSLYEVGTTITLKIPLTLAIIDGMNIRVGRSIYTIPTTAIKESFRPSPKQIVNDPDGNEMVMVRGNCYAILRLHQLFKAKADATTFDQGIFLMVEYEGEVFCLFADELLGKQQIVVKSLPNYIKKIRSIHYLAGCTLLGDGSISLILNLAAISQKGGR